jgi:hypothetical protein
MLVDLDSGHLEHAHAGGKVAEFVFMRVQGAVFVFFVGLGEHVGAVVSLVEGEQACEAVLLVRDDALHLGVDARRGPALRAPRRRWREAQHAPAAQRLGRQQHQDVRDHRQKAGALSNLSARARARSLG